MKNNINKNIMIANDEEVYKEFPKLKGRGYFCQVVITTKRLIIYTQGNSMSSNRKIKKRGMNEIELKSVTNTEYYLQYIKNSFFVRLIGFVFLIGSLILGYGIYQELLDIPAYQYSEIINYVVLGIVFLLGILLMFYIKKILFFRVVSGFNIITELELQPTKYNELALKYIASKFYSH